MEKYFGNYRGIVVKNNANGLCKIFIYGIYPDEYLNSPDELPNAEPAMPISNGNSVGLNDTIPWNLSIMIGPTGSQCVPEVGARVWVFFEGGDIRYPIYFASIPGGQAWMPSGLGIIENNTKSIKIKIDESQLITNIAIPEESTVKPVQFDTRNSNGEANAMGDMLNSVGVSEKIGSAISKAQGSATDVISTLRTLQSLKLPDIPNLPKIPTTEQLQAWAASKATELAKEIASNLVPQKLIDKYKTQLTDNAKREAQTKGNEWLNDQLDNIKSISGFESLIGDTEDPVSVVSTLQNLVTTLQELPQKLVSLLGINITCTTDPLGKVKTTITLNGDIEIIQFGNISKTQIGDLTEISVGDNIDMRLGSKLSLNTGGGAINQWPLIGAG